VVPAEALPGQYMAIVEAAQRKAAEAETVKAKMWALESEQDFRVYATE